MLVRLTKKLADVVNGIDLSHCHEGDVVELSDRHALMLVADGWAESVEAGTATSCSPLFRGSFDVAADAGLPRDDQPSVAEKLRHYYLKTSPPTPE